MSQPEIQLIQYPGLSGKTTLSPPCAKVHMVLGAKGLKFSIRNLQTPQQVKRYNKRGRVPVLRMDGQTWVDSSDIITMLDERFPNPPLLYGDPVLDARVRFMEDWADEVLYFYGVWLRWLVPANYNRLKSEVLDRMPIPIRWIAPIIGQYEVKKRAKGQGIGTKEHPAVARELSEALRNLRDLLTESPFLVGEQLTRADIAVAACLDQYNIPALCPDAAAEINSYPELVAWLDRVHQVAPNAALPAPKST